MLIGSDKVHSSCSDRSHFPTTENALLHSEMSSSTTKHDKKPHSLYHGKKYNPLVFPILQDQELDGEHLFGSNFTPQVGSSFKTWPAMLQAFKSFSAKNGFTIGRKCSYFSKERSMSLFHSTSSVMHRGQLYCLHKNSANQPCSWKMKYTYLVEEQCYVIKPDSSFHHNHDLKNDIVIHERSYVEKEKALNKDEIIFLESIGKYHSYSMAKIMELMTTKFPRRDYCKQLLWRVINKTRDIEYGPDRHRLPQLFELGQKHRAQGGTLHIGNDPDTFRLNKFILQTHSMKCYARAYADFTQIDYTHGGNKYNLLTSLPTGVDCLGKSVFFGVAINKSENFCDVSEVIELFGINKPRYSARGTIMHDNGSCFVGLDHKFSMKNILCTKHVSSNAIKVSGGLGSYHKSFLEKVNIVLYNPNFDTDDQLVKYLDMIYNECASHRHEKSCTFLSNLKSNRKQVCAFHTCHVFTAQQRASTCAKDPIVDLRAMAISRKSFYNQIWFEVSIE